MGTELNVPRTVSNALTSMGVKTAKPGRHADGGGLHLLVKRGGARSWVFRFMLRGRARDVGLGPAIGKSAVSLANARIAAATLRIKVKAGIDPIEERRQTAAKLVADDKKSQIAASTFKTIADAHLRANEIAWRSVRHRQQWHSTLITYVYPIIGDLPISDVGTDHVLKILEPIWRSKPETASRIRGRIEAILDAAKARGYRQGENPARWRGHLAQILPARTRLSRGHHKAMPHSDLPPFVARLSQRTATAALALEFTILTACRSDEVLGAAWPEVDFERAIWTIPAARTKAGRLHRVPLSPRAVEILLAVKPLGSSLLFTGDRGGKLSNMAMTMLLRRMQVDCTVHGFRSSFRDWASECTNFAHEVCEMALAHVISNKAEAAYRRGDLLEKRRLLMTSWAAYLASGEADAANVFRFARNVVI